MAGKVSWGQIVKELEFQTKAFKLLWRQWYWRGRFSEWTIEIVNRRNDTLGLWPLYSYPPFFIKSNIHAPVSLADVKKSFDISPRNPLIFPQSNIFLVHLKKGKWRSYEHFQEMGCPRAVSPDFCPTKQVCFEQGVHCTHSIDSNGKSRYSICQQSNT